MKNLIVTMLCVPTVCFGMMQPQKYVSNWVSKQATRLMQRYMQKRAYTTPQDTRLATNATEWETKVKTELAEVQAKRSAHFESTINKTWNAIARKKQDLKNVETRLEKNILKKDRLKDDLVKLYRQDQVNTNREWELRKRHDYLYDLLSDIEKQKRK